MVLIVHYPLEDSHLLVDKQLVEENHRIVDKHLLRCTQLRNNYHKIVVEGLHMIVVKNLQKIVVEKH
jgi:hypothetical protein